VVEAASFNVLTERDLMTKKPGISEYSLNRASFISIGAIVSSIFFFGLGTPFITILFGCLLLHYIGKILPKRAAILSFCVLVLILFYLFVHFMKEAVDALPLAISKAIPTLVSYANDHGFTMPFDDPEGLKKYLMQTVNSQLHFVARFTQVFTKEFVYVIIALVATCGIFATGRADLGSDSYTIRNNVYSVFTQKLSERFRNFFSSFHTVMGAQVVISSVNTFFTGLFIIGLSLFGAPLPYSFVIIVVTFLCGLLPIVGNLISNTIIFGIGLTQSVQLAVAALIYLIVLHKFEYFLNSKIIGGRIKNPMWLTLLSLLVGERLAGIPGMILAPVILNYCKLEGSAVEIIPEER
jgi:predicted PurR-regulated permease PerM